MSQKTLKIAADLELPLEIVTEKVAFLGRTGSGKTYGAMKLAELMLGAGAQIGVIDPVGVWRALRVPAEKDGAAFEVVVLGGLYGDLPLRPTAGELVADLVVDRGLSFVLDVSQFIPSEQQVFIHDFGARLFHRKKSAPSAMHLFLEECQEYIPENPSGPEARTLGVMQRLWKLGRNFGIGGSLISQRPQEIAKKALNMSGTLFAFQMTGPQERKALRAWVADQGVAVDIEQILQKLEVGQPHVESPTVLNISRTVRILPRVTADLSSTPKLGMSPAAKRPLTPIDVEQLTTAMHDVVERAKADDPKELRKRIAELERDARTAKAAAPSPSAPAKDRPVLTAEDRHALHQIRERLDALQTFCAAEAEAIVEGARQKIAAAVSVATGDMLTLLQRAETEAGDRLRQVGFARVMEKIALVTAVVPRTDVILQNRPEIAHADKKPREIARSPRSLDSIASTAASGDASLSRVHRAMLTALAQHPRGLSKQKILIHTGYAPSGPVSTAFARLLSLGAVETTALATLRLTAHGRSLFGHCDPLPVGDDLRAWLLAGPKLNTMEKKLLAAICGAYPQAIRKGDVLEQTGYASSGPVSTAFAKLVGLGYAESQGPALLRASEELFS